MGIPHKNLLLGLETHLVVLGGVVAADAGASGTAESIVCEALAVQLEASRFATVAWLMLLDRLLLHWLELVDKAAGLRALCPAMLVQVVHRVFKVGDSVVIRVTALELESLSERLLHGRSGRHRLVHHVLLVGILRRVLLLSANLCRCDTTLYEALHVMRTHLHPLALSVVAFELFKPLLGCHGLVKSGSVRALIQAHTGDDVTILLGFQRGDRVELGEGQRPTGALVAAKVDKWGLV